MQVQVFKKQGNRTVYAGVVNARTPKPVGGGFSRRSDVKEAVPQAVHRFFARYSQGPQVRGKPA